MKGVWTKIITAYNRIHNSIVFWPAIMTSSAIFMGIFLITFRDPPFESFIEDLPIIRIHDLETLRAILTSLLTGLISIAIFSFSMVMVVLSQTASHYSPKILNWMVNKRSNQMILGVYLGTIIFTLILLLQLPKDPDLRPLYQLSVFLDAILTFCSLLLFVLFINNVSNDIQISQILEGIYEKTKKKLVKEIFQNSGNNLSSLSDASWIQYKTESSGYLQKIRKEKLLKILSEKDLTIKIIQNFGFYHIKGNPLYYLNKEIKDQKILDDILSAFIFYSGERIQDHTFYGFRQISEIAVKALSPGINDPGTAYTCIDYLTDLLSLKMPHDKPNILSDKRGTARIFIHSYSFEELIKICFMPILKYGSKDVFIIENLLLALKKLANNDTRQSHKKELNELLTGILIEMEKQKENSYFYKHLEVKKNEILSDGDGYFNLSAAFCAI